MTAELNGLADFKDGLSAQTCPRKLRRPEVVTFSDIIQPKNMDDNHVELLLPVCKISCPKILKYSTARKAAEKHTSPCRC
jgi:hypothetical protein